MMVCDCPTCVFIKNEILISEFFTDDVGVKECEK